MVIDTSALVAIVLGEPGTPDLVAEINHASVRVVASVSMLEAGIVLRARRGQEGVDALYRLLASFPIGVVVFDETHAKLAISAFSRFGKGMGHRAQLNFGDCAVYALAALRGEPVLATGRDFRATDIEIVKLRK